MTKRMEMGLLFFVASGAMLYFEPGMPSVSLPVLIGESAYCAVMMPGGVVGLPLDRLFHIELSPAVLFGLSALFWLFPVTRIQRHLGTFDAFKKPVLRLPSITRGAAKVLDLRNRLRAGKGKKQGWA
jgi:hypothetical protein